LYQPPVGLLQNTFNDVTNYLGPPTVGDFDGSGQPEIAVMMYTHRSNVAQTFQDHDGRSLYVFKLDGTEVWHKDLSPGPSDSAVYNSTPTAFDFDGDGDEELVVQDQQYLYILDGRTGATRFQFALNNSPLGTKFPAVADVGNDGSAEIVATATAFEFYEPSGASAKPGIYVIGDANDNWGHARRSWNQ
jgi:outer membrane protein assembly factor BamB